ncbi:MAG: Gfo/Idh/MocA family oxidoreductase, partial [Candidatus Omnitrophica bacterium]|nr:Gfo/Idh/MocA family oxidoreductase [Candidatus Omnitrophota bacterium]
MRKRYVQVGIGGRSYLYSEAIVGPYSQYATLVGICDTNPGRMELRNERLRNQTDSVRNFDIPMYLAQDFDRMLKEQEPDTVIVTSMDCTHHEYICRAMEAGCDVLTEKPLTIDAEKCQSIIDTVRRTGRQLRVTFNYRYSPARSLVKQILQAGTIGKILSVDFFWNLNTSHGADYFRRWHRYKKNSGGLLVHKATHHFDLVNWWLSAIPEEVYCRGARVFYRPEQAERYGLSRRTERCLTCGDTDRCKFFLDLKAYPDLKRLYLDQEKYDFYYRDRCVFASDIDIEDTMNAVVSYNTGAILSYALNAFTPWEGYAISFNGTGGRLEHTCVESVYISGDGTEPGEMLKKGTSITVHPHFN